MILDGELTLSTVPTLWKRLAAKAAGQNEIDVGGVTRIDSSGLALMTALAREAGSACKITGATPTILALAEVYGVEQLLR